MVTALVVAAVIVVAAGSGLLVAYGISKQTGGSPPAAGTGKETERAGGGLACVEFGTVVANLAEGKMTRYLKADISLQVKAASAQGLRDYLASGKEAVLKNWLITYLSDKSRDEVSGAVNMNRLRREIQDGFNAVLSEEGRYEIESVLFTEFNVQ